MAFSITDIPPLELAMVNPPLIPTTRLRKPPAPGSLFAKVALFKSIITELVAP